MDNAPSPRRRFSGVQVLGFALAAVFLTAVVCFLVFKMIFPSAFTPVVLTEREEKVLQRKLDRLDFTASSPAPTIGASGAPLEPEPYGEKDADRTIRLTERELNALLGKNTDLADKVAIDLSRDLVSAKVLVPLDPDFPVMGGKTLRVKAGLTFSYADGRPVLILRGVTVMGVPMPNAWLGGVKNIDIIKEYGGDGSFWKAFADGVGNVRVEEGCVTITLKK